MNKIFKNDFKKICSKSHVYCLRKKILSEEQKL